MGRTRAPIRPSRASTCSPKSFWRRRSRRSPKNGSTVSGHHARLPGKGRQPQRRYGRHRIHRSRSRTTRRSPRLPRSSRRRKRGPRRTSTTAMRSFTTERTTGGSARGIRPTAPNSATGRRRRRSGRRSRPSPRRRLLRRRLAVMAVVGGGGGNPGSCNSSAGKDIAECIEARYPAYLAARVSLDTRKRNMQFLRDRMIEHAKCRGLDVGQNLKRGGPEISNDFIAWKTGGHLEGRRHRVGLRRHGLAAEPDVAYIRSARLRLPVLQVLRRISCN